jgi:hypothetical protein
MAKTFVPFFLFNLACFVLLPGCAGIEAIGSKLGGPEHVEAKYVPPKKPMLVLVENYRDASATQIDGEMLTRYLISELEEHHVAPLVEFNSLAALKSDTTRDFREMKIDEIGKAVGAAQVLYVDLAQAEVNRPLGGETFIARGAARVRIVDSASGETRWPEDAPGGSPIAFETRAISAAQGGDDPTFVRQKLHEGLALRIARLFYKWSPED